MNKNLNINYIDAIEKELTRQNIPHTTKDMSDKSKMFVIPIRTSNIPGMFIMMFVGEDGDVVLRSYLATGVLEEESTEIMQLLNRLNVEYRFVTLSLNDIGEVCAATDFLLVGDEKTACKQLMTMLHVYSGICNDCAPEIMNAVWSDRPWELSAGLFMNNLSNKNGGNNK